MGLSSSPSPQLKSRVEEILGPVNDKRIELLLSAVERTLVKQQEATKTHSFQIVSLQNQILKLENSKIHEIDDKDSLLEELIRTRTEIAYLKGKLAGLTVEFYSTGQGTSTNRVRQLTTELVSAWNDSPLVDLSVQTCRTDTGVVEVPDAVKDGTADTKLTTEKLADRILSEQRPLLIKGLQDFVAQHTSSSEPAPVNELGQPQILDTTNGQCGLY
ncbi:hypothetical protein QQS21_001182 [Conoideocrella luteorostrata]|uniref:Uncharacterized protein n=1 Tax=Conoideocrella luteorostrata TaxID=1105319 RepID=A0AAJ0CXK5_9HYPO|nr:hypothetical protein QQS21_001182 [Conoideocrella luteorostrata]